MRHLVLILMIALLPLRGWAGDVMATQMATQTASTVAAIETGAARAHELAATASFDHKNQAFEAAQGMPDCHTLAAGQPDADKAASSDHCGTCQACQACHTVALSSPTLDVVISFVSPQLRPIRAAAFTSAVTALGQKPPIS